MPDTAVAGTAHDADSAQFPQSIRPVERLVSAGRLRLRQRRGRRQVSRDQPGSQALVVAHPVDIQPIRPGGRLDLEVYGLPDVDADVGGEPLNRRTASTGDVPLTRRGARLAVLARDRVDDRGPARASRSGRRHAGQLDGHTYQHCDEHHGQDGGHIPTAVGTPTCRSSKVNTADIHSRPPELGSCTPR